MSPVIAALLADIKDEALVEELRKRKWTVYLKSPFDWETPSAFSQRHGRHNNWLVSRIARKTGVPKFETERSKDGRLIRLLSNPELEAFATFQTNRRHEHTLRQTDHTGAESPAPPSRKKGAR